MYAAKRGIITKSEDVWLCLNCEICEVTCPNSIRISDIILEARRKILEMHGEDRVFEYYSSYVRALLNSGVIAFITSTRVSDFKAENRLDIPMLSESVRAELYELMKRMNLEAKLKEVMGVERE